MGFLTNIVLVLTSINTAFDFSRNVTEARDSRRKRIADRAGRRRPRMAARKLEALGGKRAKVRAGLSQGKLMLVVERWSEGKPPDTFMGYPVQAPQITARRES